MLMPELHPFHNLIRELEYKNELALAEGNNVEAYNVLLQQSKLGHFLIKKPVLISQLVGIAADGIFYTQLQRSLSLGSFTSLQLEILQQRLKEIEPQPRAQFKRAMIGERIFGLEVLDVIVKNPHDLALLTGVNTNKVMAKVLLKLYTCFVLDFDMTNVLKCYASSIDEMKKPIEVIDFARSKQMLKDYKYSILLQMIFPAFIVAFHKNVDSLVVNRCAQTAVAVELYRRDYLKTPDSLPQLVPKYLGAVPLDPYTNKPLLYKKGLIKVLFREKNIKTGDYEDVKHEKSGYMIYSVGKNKKPEQSHYKQVICNRKRQ